MQLHLIWCICFSYLYTILPKQWFHPDNALHPLRHGSRTTADSWRFKSQMYAFPQVNGVWRKLPLTLGGGAIQIKNNPAAVTLGTHFGLSVSCDKAGAVHVNLPPTYSNQVCGLCGNFNHFSGDDLTKPDGADAEDATALAQSWRTEGTSASCEAILVPHQCDPLEEAEYAGELYCGGLVSGTGPFADCLSALGAESYFRSCVMGMCSAQGDPRVLCEKLQFYANICQAAGVAVPVWRNSTYCSMLMYIYIFSFSFSFF